MIAKRIARVGISATMSIAATAKRMRADGIDVIDLSIGEPDFPTPDYICDAAIRAMRDGDTHYTANPGTLSLRKAIATKFARANDLDVDPANVIVSAGAKQSLYLAIAALIEEGDRVLIPVPFWVSYPEMVRLAGGEPVFVPTREENSFKLTIDDVAPYLSGAKVLILNSPNNPTGAVVPADDLREIATSAANAGLFILSDEIYEHLIYDDAEYRAVASLDASLPPRTLTINGVSKAYAMTGWRIGYATGPKWLTSAMSVVQSHSTSNACSISQAAAEAALSGPQDAVAKMRAMFAERRLVMFRGLDAIPGWTCVRSEGAFYAYPNVSAAVGKSIGERVITSSLDLADYLLEHAHVAVVPGEAFGTPGYLRISYAAATERIEEAIGRMAKAIAALS